MLKSNYLDKKSFIDLNKVDVEKLVKEVGEKKFRINQINNWIYNHFVETWSEMINLPKSLINQLEKRIRLHPLELIEISGNETDPTRKFLFKTIKGNKIESVLMHNNNRTRIRNIDTYFYYRCRHQHHKLLSFKF